MTTKLKIAILGTRGIPGRYGGFETFAEEIAKRLVVRGHEVSVFGRRKFFEPDSGPALVHGARVIRTPTIMHKYLETPLHALTSFIRALGMPFDAIILCNAANSPFAWILNAKKSKLLINVDGIERKRSKWNSLGRLWYLLGEQASVWFADRVIADADVIADYYRDKFKIEPVVIRYGAERREVKAGDVLSQFGLRPREYILYVSRLEPENNARGVIEAYRQVKTAMPLVIVGDAPYAAEYKAELRALADERVIFTGFQFEAAYRELRSNPYAYVQATEVGGTHPALVEAMMYGNCTVANHVPEHEEVLRDCGLYYRKNDFLHLAEQLQRIVNDPALRDSLGEAARERADDVFSWEKIVDAYESLIIHLSVR